MLREHLCFPVLTPFIMDFATARSAWFARNLRLLNIPAQLALVFVLFGGMVPVGCALFPQRASVEVESLRRWEPEAHKQFTELGLRRVFYNKGL